ncbi:phosphatidylcholine and lysophosphatidylcholine phospholipase, partial [Coemansia furcata]
MGHTPPLPLAEIPSLVNELDLYHLPDSFVLVEQGQRPEGLYIILDGRVEITHRDSITEFAGGEARMKKPGDVAVSKQLADRTSISNLCRQMTELARKETTSSLSPRSRPASIDREPYSYDSARMSVANMRSTHSLYESINESENSDYAQPAGRQRADSSRAPRPYHARAGDVVGYLPALTDMASLYTARSKGSVLVGFVSRWALDRIGERYPIILMTLARRLTSQLPLAILNIDYALEWVQVKASQMVYRQGEMSDAVYVVLTGRLRAFVEKDNGAISILAEFGQGQSVGEPNLLLNDACKFNLHAIRDTELVRIPTALFKALMHTAPRLTFHLSRTLAVRATQSLQQLLIVEQQLGSGAGLVTSLESGIRTHNGNLKSIAIIPVNADVPVRAFAEQLEETLAGIAGSVALLDHTAVSRVLGRHAFSRIARLKIVSWISELEQRCRLLLHVADGGISSPWTRHCVRHSDFVLLVGLGDGDPSVGEFERLLLALKTTARKELVLLHENRSCTTGTTREWLKRRAWVHAHHHIQMPLGLEEYGLTAEGSSDDSGISNGSGGRNGHNAASVLERARSLIFKSILQPSGRVLANGGIGIIKTSLQKYYRRLTRSRKLTPVAYQGHRSDFARLGRYLCGKSIGVVLSGGGARGIALLGVLQAFEEAGIPVDMIGGTSIGAFMSGLYAQNPDSVAIHGPVKAFSRRMSSMWRFLLDVTYPILAYTSGREFNRAIWKVFKEAEIEDLWLPFYCMTANITQSRPEVHTRGLLWRVVRASMSLGGFVPPLCDENGDLLVDGGYLDNLPVRIMKNELGANMIFAIDIAGENDTSPVRYGESVSGFWVLLNHLNPFRSYWIPTLSEVQSRLTYASSDKELESAKIADSCVYLRVPPRDVGVLDFGRFDELYRRGYEYSKAWTARWQQARLLEPWQTTAGKPAVRGSSADESTRPAYVVRDLVLQIVREAFWSEYGVQDRHHRLAYLQHIYRHTLVSRAWREALQPYIDKYLIIRLKRRARRSVLQYGSALANMIPRWPFSGVLREAGQSVGNIRHRDGSALCFRSNLPLMAKRGAHLVQTIVLAVDGEMQQAHIDRFLTASGFCLYQWSGARTLCFQLEIESSAYPFERTVKTVLWHAPNIASFYMARPRQTLAPVKMSLERAFGGHCRRLERIEIHIAISCYDIPSVLPALTSLSLSLTTSDSETVVLPRLASSSLKRLSLYNVEADVLHSLFYGDGDGAIVFSELTMLKLCLRTHLVGILESSAAPHTMALRPLVFPRLESAHIFGYQHNIPAALFQALSSAP